MHETGSSLARLPLAPLKVLLATSNWLHHPVLSAYMARCFFEALLPVFWPHSTGAPSRVSHRARPVTCSALTVDCQVTSGKRKGSAQKGFCKHLFYELSRTPGTFLELRAIYSWTLRGITNFVQAIFADLGNEGPK